MFLLTLSDNSTLIIGCTVLSIGLGGMTWASFGVNHLDIGAGVIGKYLILNSPVSQIKNGIHMPKGGEGGRFLKIKMLVYRLKVEKFGLWL